MSGTEPSLVTPRLRLVPIGPDNAGDFWLVHNDDAVVPWYDGWRPSRDEAALEAGRVAASWRLHGVHKWMAYERTTGELVGRGGLSRTPIDDDWGQLYDLLPPEPWVHEVHESDVPYRAHATWAETGWALRREHWGRGYATEIGAASLAYAFDVMGLRAVVSCTVRHNVRSQAVMDRIGMRYAGEIRSRGTTEGVDGVRDDAPFAVFVKLRDDGPAEPPDQRAG